LRLGPGSVVAGRYRLTRLLGEGGMGDVWEASNTVTGRAVAIKRLRLSRADVSGVSHARFVREAQAACAVAHPNVVEVLDFVDSVDEPPIIVMELLRGETLAAYVEGGQTLAPEAVARLLLPVVSAVGTAHARGIVHRDLKPANIFLQEDGDDTKAKVLDFGIAKWVSALPSDVALLTETGSTLGTPCYMAPEQALGERVIDHRADVWAIGVILYECLTGMRPVEGENAAQIVVRLLRTGIMPIERLVPSLPSELAELVMRMLAREANQRPGSLHEAYRVLSTLTPLCVPEFGEPEVPLAPASGELGLSAGATEPALATSIRAPTRAPRRLLPAALGGLAVLVAVGLWQRRAPESAVPKAAHAAVAGSSAPSPPMAPTIDPTPVSGPSPAAHASAAPVPDVALATVALPRQRASVKASRSRTTVTSAAPSAQPPTPSGLPPGAACERSRDCVSNLCLAFSCR
jgi:eukaryotic-like serine/threonine-protein kinase